MVNTWDKESDSVQAKGRKLHGLAEVIVQDGGEPAIDEDFAQRGFHNICAWIMGRNMFGPVRGPWPDDSWRGWWQRCAVGRRGERLFDGVNLPALGYACTQHQASELATHVVFSKQ